MKLFEKEKFDDLTRSKTQDLPCSTVLPLCNPYLKKIDTVALETTMVSHKFVDVRMSQFGFILNIDPWKN
jgi:hypothetical protein